MLQTVIDMMGRVVNLPKSPERIVSLVPSQTELICDLGLGEKLVGITNFCIHPKSVFKTVRHIGGTKKVNFETIKDLEPDLIIGNKEENAQSDIEALAKLYPVWMSDIRSYEAGLTMNEQVADLLGVPEKGAQLNTDIRSAFNQLTPAKESLRVLYLIWQKPFMGIGTDTFIAKMIEKAGHGSVPSTTDRYPELTEETIRELNPDVIFLSSEPFPFKEKNRIKIQETFPESKVVLVDGELFSWYGSRQRLAPDYFNALNDLLG